MITHCNRLSSLHVSCAIMGPCVWTALVVLASVVSCALQADGMGNSNISQAKAFLRRYDKAYGDAMNAEALAEWSYNTDISKVTMAHLVDLQVALANFSKSAFEEANSYAWRNFAEPDTYRQFQKITNIGPSALKDPQKVKKMSEVTSELESIYSTAQYCPTSGNCLDLEPGLTRVMANSRNSTELLNAWWGWRYATGPKMKDLYTQLVTLSNEGVQDMGGTDTGKYWRSWYESPTFKSDLEELLDELQPLYQQLHAYIKRRLIGVYGKDIFPSTGHIPAHLLGNMWAQQWNNIYDIVVPFKNKPMVDVTDKLKQDYTVEKMFETAEGFYKSLGLEAMPDTFWKNSMLKKPTDGRKVICHASAWDFYDAKDYRIKMCTDINMEDLITIHHEMGHIEYFLLYRHQPQVYRDGANPGFHEAIGDTMALSATTPAHLRKIGLLEAGEDDNETDINFLMKMALEKIAFLPFGYLIDQWRWNVFSGDTPPSRYNHDWWDLRCKYQGIAPPIPRTEYDFDPGAKFHVSNNVPYIRYFVSFVIQFQFHQALCQAANHTGPLHRCDIYNSKAAGTKLRNALSLGSSKPWPDVMTLLTGQDKMNVSALMEYFKPLSDWLKLENGNDDVSWSEHCPVNEGLDVEAWLKTYNDHVQVVQYEAALADWTYNTNITDYNQDRRVEAELKSSQFTKEAAGIANTYNLSGIHDTAIARQLEMIRDIGTDALKDEKKIKQLSEVQAKMEGIFSTGKVCLDKTRPDDCLDLEPGIARKFANSRDYYELQVIWKQWRDVTGKKMKTLYTQLVDLSNEGVRELGYNDTGEYWRSSYETPTFQQDLEKLLDQLKPLYQGLHTYVRRELKKIYGKDKFPVTGHIPAHLLGNIWAQEWEDLFDLLQPFKHKQSVDITPTLKAKNFTTMDMFRTAEDFYKSIGLTPMPQTFWHNSMLEKPKDGRDVVCYASAWDMSNTKDFRIKMCTDITMEDLITIHHEMGHIEYYLQYRGQPWIFRGGANHGFHEAIGDTMALSASTPKHLRRVNLLAPGPEDDESDLNFLMKTALEKIAFLPFGYLIDQWRWSVFSGETPPSEYNKKWWDLRCKYQGISPPVARSEDDFDPGAKYHVAANVPYIRYFVSFVIQFQFHKALCTAAKQTGPLHRCDIYQSKDAGDKLRSMLSMGSSKPWQEAMEVMTGQRKMDASALMEYFQPLTTWLEEQNALSATADDPGWTEICPDPSGKITDEESARQLMQEYDKKAMEVLYRSAEASWTYNTNITDYNSQLVVNESLKETEFSQKMTRKVNMYDWEHFQDEVLRREFNLSSVSGPSALSDPEKIKRLSEVEAQMEGLYSKAQVKVKGVMSHLEPEITQLFATSRDYDLLSDVWKGWRDATGPKIKPLYEEFVQLSNEGVQADGFSDTGQYWRSSYETLGFEDDMEALLDQLKPLYQQLHAYVRSKLIDTYGKEKFPKSGHIPAHLFGNMWAQQWNNIYDILQPFKGKAAIDVSPEMETQNYTVLQMFKTAETFYKSLGLLPMPQAFWDKSMISRPQDGRSVVCHASAWDFSNKKDFRIKMCTDINMEDLITIHHEMGHIQYYLQYKDQPIAFKGGANPGFHEAIGDTMALSVSTPKHLRKIGLLKNLVDDNETDINFLMKMALEKIAFLPFGYLIDQWRWSVFSGDTPPEEYNRKWWDLRCKHQGLTPPIHRGESDFDPGAKYHVPANTPYIRYFVSFIIQFQFHKALCQAANQTGPLHKCDIYQSKAAGERLSNMLKMGQSKPWPDAMEIITGQRKMDVGPLVEYFKPLLDWLEEENSGKSLGWDETCPPGMAGKITDEDVAKDWLKEYNQRSSEVYYEATEAEYTYNTNITEYTIQASVEANLKVARFDKESAAKAAEFETSVFPDTLLQREFKLIKDIGTSALKNETKLARMEKLRSDMQGIYSKGRVCLSSGRCLDLEPGLTRLMASSRNYSELQEAWRKWRDITGKTMKTMYQEFASLSNEGVQALGYADTGEYWRSWYESDTFKEGLQKLLAKLKPFYQQLHGYVRRKLKAVYGAEHFPYSGHIPAHLLGNMWAQAWKNIYDIVIPFRNKTSMDVTPEMKEQGYTVEKMFWTAENFFKSLGLEAMPMEFWRDSMIRRPSDRDVVCHASAWDFYNAKDFRIKMCTDINMEDLITIHHEMGHIQYYLQYRHQPHAFRDGANPGFHEAIGDVMALSASTPNHLKTIGLLEKVEDDPESDINFLMATALDKIAFLPFGYLIDQWRWSVFSGESPIDNYNTKWWELRCQYQGVSAPVARSEADFDPGAKFHVPANTPYIRYFVSYVIQFQFHKALCTAAGHTGPLHKCDIYNSKAAGTLLGNVLKLGASKPWPEVMEMMTGGRDMDVGAVIEYFQPLFDWLEKENEGEELGWSDGCPSEDDNEAAAFLQDYDKEAEKHLVKMTVADWAYQTNLTEETSKASVQGRLDLADFQKQYADKANKIDWRNLEEESMKRQFQKITDIGTSAMKDKNKLKQMEQLQSQMEDIYGAGKVCLTKTDCRPLTPALEEVMASSRDYDLLLKVWKGWRDNTGKKMKDLYRQFAELSNEGVRELNYKDTGDYWRSAYESNTFQQDIQELLAELRPLYEQLHTYIRKKLADFYGHDRFPASGHIPAHILGNMWGQTMENIFDIVQPYKNRTSVDITPQMKKQNYTVERMFRTAEGFFVSLGLNKMVDSFWTDSMMRKPAGREVVCHPSAWDFYNAKDFRIKMCTDINMVDLITIHHEMGHIEYFMQYRHQPQPFRDGANPGFHEAIGDTMALSAATPAHLKKIGLLDQVEDNPLDDINFLMKTALGKIAFLPFGYLIDQWRWSVFSGETPPSEYNKKWWDLRCKYQGLSPPVLPSDDDFDPGAKYHIPDNTPYIRYFVSFVIQFQFHKALCQAANHTGPLHKCDIYQSKDAGKLLGDVLKMGSSKSWPDAMEAITGQRKMDAGPLKEYFKPLSDWLQQENVKERPGWTESCPEPEEHSNNKGHSPSNGSVHWSTSYTSGMITVLILLFNTFQV
ncbi:uncharacterized protein [Haliotis asinina]|uniref:uncharacterized protein n=1 Tax=Haliotis asinina TaxID=109174 RepID=UPI003532215B